MQDCCAIRYLALAGVMTQVRAIATQPFLSVIPRNSLQHSTIPPEITLPNGEVVRQQITSKSHRQPLCHLHQPGVSWCHRKTLEPESAVPILF